MAGKGAIKSKGKRKPMKDAKMVTSILNSLDISHKMR
jgi:hypothetical protein